MVAAQKKLLIVGVALGTIYALAARFGIGAAHGLPTLAFLFLVPLGIGAVPLLMADPDQLRLYRSLIFIPWLSILTSFAAMIALRAERLGCLLILLVPYVALAGLAMLVTLIICVVKGVRLKRRKRQAAAAAILLLPFLLAPLEQRYLASERTVEVSSSIVVAAPADQVWGHLSTVETIQDWEYRPGLLSRALEIPRPIRASVDREGLGARRHGEFANGMVFDELIKTYDRPSLMAFDIALDPSRLEEGSSERHAFGEGYFRFVDATYRLDPEGPGRVRLALSSRYVLRTSVNWYGRLWADAVVREFQDAVLAVLKGRSEGKAGASAGPLARVDSTP